ncbi:hypothetical protein FALBO_3805 [Fusarium albosuccineum]|uniref:Uncharacterized protein n=1 Tax=Fusarium albosuccineum TaxID=1237068 RepID=A0A8H4LGN5_9HYPO|nr:hypothetical protein FALBO_3805 [Fusarium albosuccineum]
MSKHRLSSFPQNWVLKRRKKDDGAREEPNSSRFLSASLPQSWRKHPSFDTVSLANSQDSNLSQLTRTTFVPGSDTASQMSFETRATTPSTQGTQRSYMPAYNREWTLPSPAPSQLRAPAGILPEEPSQRNTSEASANATNVVLNGAGDIPVELDVGRVDSSASRGGHPSTSFGGHVFQMAGGILDYGSHGIRGGKEWSSSTAANLSEMAGGIPRLSEARYTARATDSSSADPFSTRRPDEYSAAGQLPSGVALEYARMQNNST